MAGILVTVRDIEAGWSAETASLCAGTALQMSSCARVACSQTTSGYSAHAEAADCKFYWASHDVQETCTTRLRDCCSVCRTPCWRRGIDRTAQDMNP